MKGLVLTMLLMMLVSLSSAASYFKVVDVSPVVLQPNSEANFTVKVQNLGSETEVVKLVFKNLTEGLSIASAGGAPYIFPVQVHAFNCTMRAGDVAPGNYSYDVGVYARGAAPNWRIAYAIVGTAGTTGSEVRPVQVSPVPVGEALNASRNISGNITSNLTVEPSVPTPVGNKTGGRAAPGPGALLAIAALIAAARRIRS